MGKLLLISQCVGESSRAQSCLARLRDWRRWRECDVGTSCVKIIATPKLGVRHCVVIENGLENSGEEMRNKEAERTKSGEKRRQKRGDNGNDKEKQIQFDDWIHIAECASS